MNIALPPYFDKLDEPARSWLGFFCLRFHDHERLNRLLNDPGGRELQSLVEDTGIRVQAPEQTLDNGFTYYGVLELAFLLEVRRLGQLSSEQLQSVATVLRPGCLEGSEVFGQGGRTGTRSPQETGVRRDGPDGERAVSTMAVDFPLSGIFTGLAPTLWGLCSTAERRWSFEFGPKVIHRPAGHYLACLEYDGSSLLRPYLHSLDWDLPDPRSDRGLDRRVVDCILEEPSITAGLTEEIVPLQDAVTVSPTEAALLQAIRRGMGQWHGILVRTTSQAKGLDGSINPAIVKTIDYVVQAAAHGQPGDLWEDPLTKQINARRGKDGRLIFDQVVQIKNIDRD